MFEWQKQVQMIVEEIDACILQHDDAALTLTELSRKLGYSEFYLSRKFKEISGLQFRDYLRQRRLAFALTALRDTKRSILEIAVDYGFSSHEAFTRAFKELYGLTPSEYRCKKQPLVLRTKIHPFDCCFLGREEQMMNTTPGEVKSYFVTIPAHKFLHIRNYESIGYWDFWQKNSLIPGKDCDTITGLLASMKGNLDDCGDEEINAGSGQLMAYINSPQGRVCSWGIPLIECYGVRFPMEYDVTVPEHFVLTEVPEGEYIVFEHGPFDYATENRIVEDRIEVAMAGFDYENSGYRLDLTEGRVFYFYHDQQRYWKYVRPVKKI